MHWSVQAILVLIALILTVVALIKPAWPLLPVSLLLVCVALLAGYWKP